jgi:hypothetical protein
MFAVQLAETSESTLTWIAGSADAQRPGGLGSGCDCHLGF